MNFKQKSIEIQEQFKIVHPTKRLVALIKAGSHFFGTNGENSDMDFRGIYLPMGPDTKTGQCKMGTNPGNKTGVKNTKDDVDVDIFSVYKVLDLAVMGDFNMIELLCAPDEVILKDSELYRWIRTIRKSFFTQNISSFIGFVKKEYNRFGITGNTYKVQVDFLEFIKDWPAHDTLKDHWDKILERSQDKNNLIRITHSDTGNGVSMPSMVLAHRLFQWTVKVAYIRGEITDKLDRYGHRKMNTVDGCDFKGLYHAKRLIEEAKIFVEHGDLQLPLKPELVSYLKSIKDGKVDKDALCETIEKDIDLLRSYDNYNEGKEKALEFASRVKMDIEASVPVECWLRL